MGEERRKPATELGDGGGRVDVAGCVAQCEGFKVGEEGWRDGGGRFVLLFIVRVSGRYAKWRGGTRRERTYQIVPNIQLLQLRHTLQKREQVVVRDGVRQPEGERREAADVRFEEGEYAGGY